jgi:protease-4
MKKIRIGLGLSLLLLSANIHTMSYVKHLLGHLTSAQKEQPSIVCDLYLDSTTNLFELSKYLYAASQQEKIKAILLCIDCNGGPCDLFCAVHDVVLKVREKKPVVAFIVGSANSGAYLVASAADYVIAGTFSEVGNIGVVLQLQEYHDPSISGPLKAKLKVHTLYAGTHKTLGNPYEKLTHEGKKAFQEEINTIYQLFLGLVARNRSLNIEDSKVWAEGKKFMASQALQIGLIDKIGTMFDVDAKLHELITQKNPGQRYSKTISYMFF